MKFIVNSAILLKEVQKLGSVITANNNLPILDNFLFDIKEGKIDIVASDLETTMVCSIKAETKDEGKITIPARILMDTLKTFSNQPLTFLINNEIAMYSHRQQYILMKRYLLSH